MKGIPGPSPAANISLVRLVEIGHEIVKIRDDLVVPDSKAQQSLSLARDL